MAKIWLDHSDGRYFTRLLSDEEAAKRDVFDVVHLEDNVYEAYVRHCDRDATWQVLWRSISNEQYMRRREKELMPLEDAEREIRRLTDELAQAKRMWQFYEGEYARHGREKHREKFVELTCVYPLPGCDVDVLPQKWQEHAREILEDYSEKHAADGMKAQGCCCGSEHVKLDEATAAQFRAKGFIVEHDVVEE